MILLTSFEKSKRLNGWERFSVARYQPEGFDYTVLEFLSATGKDGDKLLLEEPEEFESRLTEGFRARWGDIYAWLKSLTSDSRIALACWCPYSRHSRKHLKERGSFYCHTGIIGKLINKHRPDIGIILDDDRERRLAAGFKPRSISTEDIPLEVFGQMDRAIAVDSNLLKERISLISHPGIIADAVSYTAEELEVVADMSPEELQATHEIKKIFRGRILNRTGG